MSRWRRIKPTTGEGRSLPLLTCKQVTPVNETLLNTKAFHFITKRCSEKRCCSQMKWSLEWICGHRLLESVKHELLFCLMYRTGFLFWSIYTHKNCIKCSSSCPKLTFSSLTISNRLCPSLARYHSASVAQLLCFVCFLFFPSKHWPIVFWWDINTKEQTQEAAGVERMQTAERTCSLLYYGSLQTFAIVKIWILITCFNIELYEKPPHQSSCQFFKITPLTFLSL